MKRRCEHHRLWPPVTPAAVLLGLVVTLGVSAVGGALAQEEMSPTSVTADTVSVSPALDSVFWENPVNPTRAVLLTPVFPGWGQLNSDNSWRAALAFGVEMFYWSRLLLNDRKSVRMRDFADAHVNPDFREPYDRQIDEYHELVRDNAWWSFGVMMIIALDAYVGAHLFQFDQDTIPVPNNWEADPRHAVTGPLGTPSPEGMVVFQWRATF